jgi:hypothetical protein
MRWIGRSGRKDPPIEVVTNAEAVAEPEPPSSPEPRPVPRIDTAGGVQAAALLIAAKRADSIASEIAVHTERNTDDIKAPLRENTELTQAVKKNTDLLEEIHRY